MFLQGKAIGKPFKVAPCLTSFHRNLRAFQCHFFQENFGQWFVNNLWRRALFPWGVGFQVCILRFPGEPFITWLVPMQSSNSFVTTMDFFRRDFPMQRKFPQAFFEAFNISGWWSRAGGPVAFGSFVYFAFGTCSQVGVLKGRSKT